MRLFILILLSIVGLSPIASNAGTLEGDWLQDDPDDASINEKRAISLPITQSTETTRVTLGIKSPGTTDLVDFFLIISNKTASPGCQYTVDEVIIDSKSFPVSSTTHISEISGLKARTADEQKRIWKAFRKGQKLSLKIRQICNAENVSSSEINTFDFSLKGSSAAYRFVIGQEIIASQYQENVKDEGTADVAKPKDTRINVEDESIETSLVSWLLALLVVVLLIIRFLRQAKSDSIKPTPVSGSAKSDPHIGDYSREKESIDAATKNFQPSPETKEPFISNPKQNITNLPRYKVEHVIDGDTAVVSSFSNKLKIRMDSIDCPEDGQDWGDIAKAGLIKLIGGRHVYLEEHGTDRYERMLTTLYVSQENESEWINVNERMVTLGHAWVMRAYYKHLPKHRQDKLNKLESWAKSKKVGLWKSPNPVPPWNWRNGD